MPSPLRPFAVFIQLRFSENVTRLEAHPLLCQHIADLVLVYHALGRHPEAERQILTLCKDVQRTGTGGAAPGHDQGDLAQLLFERLLVIEDGTPPKLAQYGGQGPLRSWIKVCNARMRSTLQRKKSPELVESEILDALLVPHGSSAESQLIAQGTQVEVRRALAFVLRGLPAQARNVLRMSVCEGLSIDVVGAAYSVHRATASRWLVDIRQAVNEGVHAELKRTLNVDTLDAQSMLRQAVDDLDASLIRYFKLHLEPDAAAASHPAA